MYSNSSLKATGANLGATDLGKFSAVVPNSLKFTSSKRGIGARRIPVKLRAEQQSYSSNNNKKIRILFPNNALYDTRNGYMTFDINVSANASTYVRVHQGVFSVFNRLTIVSGATEVEDLRDYNRIYSALWKMINPPDVVSSIGNNLMGFGSQADRNLLYGSGTVSLCCPVYSGILNTELLPFDNINGMFMDFYLEDPTMCVETDGTSPNVTLSNIIFHVERLELDGEYREYIKNYVNTNGLNIGFHTWERYINTLTTGTQQTLTIQHKSSSMNGMLNLFVNSTEINLTTVNDKFITWPSSPAALGASAITQSQLLINGAVFPDEPIDCINALKAEPYQMYCRWIMKWKLNGFLPIAPPITNDAFNGNAPFLDSFVQIDDLEAYPEEMDLINPFTTLGNNATLLKKIQFLAALPAGWQLDSWVEYFRQIVIQSNGNVVVLQ